MLRVVHRRAISMGNVADQTLKIQEHQVGVAEDLAAGGKLSCILLKGRRQGL